MNSEVERVALARINACSRQIEHSLRAVERGNPYAAETDAARRLSRIQAKTGVSRPVAETIEEKIEQTGTKPPARPAEGLPSAGYRALSPALMRAAMSSYSSAHCSPAPPWTSPSMFTPVAMTLLSPTPQVAAIRAAAIDGA